MGLTKQYLRFLPGQVLNLVCHSSASNCCFVSGKGRVTRFLAVAAAQNVVIWDLNTNTEACTILGDQSEVTQLASWSNDLKNYLCVGYNDGTINVYDLASETHGEEDFSVGAPVAFKGHRSGVSCFLFDPAGLFLVSGGKDSEIVVWDLVKESGLFRLKGHKGPVTGLKFFPGFAEKQAEAGETETVHFDDPEARLERMKDLGSVLVSSAKDGMLKFWDLNTRHCCFTLAVPSAEVWDFEFLGPSWTKQNAVRFAVGSSTSDVVIWEASEPSNASDVPNPELEDTENGDEASSSDGIRFRCDKIGTIIRSTKGRTTGIKYLPKSRVLFISGQDKTIEAFRVCTEAECKKRVKKRMKKQAKQDVNDVPEEAVPAELSLSDQIMRRTDANVFASGRVKTFAVSDMPEKRKGGGGIMLVCGLANNQVESFSVDFELTAEEKSAKKQKGQVQSIGKIDKPGHRSDVRVLDFSSDSTGLMSASAEALKIWARDGEGAWGCVRTIPCRYSVCGTFLPGDRHVVLGCRTGHVQLFDVAGGSMLEEVQTAEEGGGEGKAVCSICLSPNKKGFVTGSENKTVQFWDMEYVSEEGAKRLSFLHSRTLKMDESVLVVKFSPDGRLLAVACLDSTVKVFFADTLKFFVSLYGHKLPVLGLDISADSRLIATASSDRTIKMWGLDFGDCHKTMLGHADSIMAVKFLPPSTHHLMSAARDGQVKYWDADSHQLISTLKGHLGEVWALAASPDGLVVATSSRDGSIRLWEKSQEIIVLEDEREMEREEEENKELEAELAKEAANATSVVEANAEAGLASLPSVSGEDACQRLMEALTVIQDIAPEWRKALKKAKPGQSLRSVGFDPHPKMIAYQTEEDPYGLLMETIARIPSSRLEECLTFLPYEYVRALVETLRVVIRRWRGFGTVDEDAIKVETDAAPVLATVGEGKLKNYLEYAESVLRTVFFLVRIQHGHIMADGNFLHSALAGLAQELSRWSEEANDMVGFNLAGLEALELKIKENDAVDIFEEAFSRQKKKKKSQKRQRRLLEVEQALLSLS